MTPPGPTVLRWKLGQILAELRNASGVRRETAAACIGVTAPQISHFEAGRRVPRMLELRELLTIYGAIDKLTDLEEVRVGANQRGWWVTYRLPSWMPVYLGLESDAIRVRSFALELIPGLLQTYDYAASTLARHGATPEEVQQGAEVRMERQARIGKELDIQVVLSEAALVRTRHMGEVSADQLVKLSTASDTKGVELLVLPFAAGGHRSMSGSFTLLDFPEGLVETVAYREGALHGDLTDDPRAVTRLDEVFADMVRLSLDREESSEFLAEFASNNV